MFIYVGIVLYILLVVVSYKLHDGPLVPPKEDISGKRHYYRINGEWILK